MLTVYVQYVNEKLQLSLFQSIHKSVHKMTHSQKKSRRGYVFMYSSSVIIISVTSPFKYTTKKRTCQLHLEAFHAYAHGFPRVDNFIYIFLHCVKLSRATTSLLQAVIFHITVHKSASILNQE